MKGLKNQNKSEDLSESDAISKILLGPCNPHEQFLYNQSNFFKTYFIGGFFFSYFIQHCFICRHSDSTVPTDAGIEPRTVATGALAAYLLSKK
jgi:hypothetical protein